MTESAGSKTVRNPQREVNPCRVRRGIVTTHPDVSTLGSGPHFAANCCGAARCTRRLVDAAKAVTGLDATYISDESRRKGVPA